MAKTTVLDGLEKTFTSEDLLNHGVSRNLLNSMLKEGEIVRLSRGVYQKTLDQLDEFEQCRAGLLTVGKPSAISMLSALSLYGLTDHIPGQIWVLVPNQRKTTVSGLKLIRSRHPRWEVGIDNIQGIAVTSVERTIIETTQYKGLGKTIGIAALKTALSLRKTNILAVSKTAALLEASKLMDPILEVLL